MTEDEFNEMEAELKKSFKLVTSAKKEYLKGIQTRLRPNTYEPDDQIWTILRSGLIKMNIDQLMVLEALISGRVKRLEEWVPGL